MRIQHNIMAMNAYRNYTNNVNAMKKNLEKLSSGYKINRAGDDAAGLAISEKMRAQITGLQVAQKNAKDGISLVQTAEGALTEVHDMLNRMYSLAEQSANGTYQNEVDREQMQKEIVQLKDEIDRISKSTNFNGIKLLDGSLGEASSTAVVKVANPESLNLADGININAPRDGEGQKAQLDITFDNGKTTENPDGTQFGAGDKVSIKLDHGNGVTKTYTFNYDASNAAAANPDNAATGKFKGDTFEEQMNSLAAQINATTDFSEYTATVKTNDDGEAIGVTLTAKTDATVPSKTLVGGAGTGVIVEDQSIKVETSAFTPGANAGTAATQSTNTAIKNLIVSNAADGTATEIQEGATVKFQFSVNGANLTITLKASKDGAGENEFKIGNNTDATTTNIVNALTNAHFDQDTVDNTTGASVATAGVDETQLKFSDYFTATANHDGAATGKSGSIMIVADSSKAGNQNSVNAVTKAQVTAADGTAAAAINATGSGSSAASTDAEAEATTYKFSNSFSAGDKVTLTGALSDGRNFEITLTADAAASGGDKKFAIGADAAASAASIKTVLESGDCKVKVTDANGNATEVAGNEIFGTGKHFALAVNNEELTITNAKAGAAGIKGATAKFSSLQIQKVGAMSVTDATATAGATPGKAENVITFDPAKIESGTTIQIDGKKYEFVTDASRKSGDSNTIAVEVEGLGDTATAKDIATSLAKALDSSFDVDNNTGNYTASLAGSDAHGKGFKISVTDNALVLKSVDEGAAAKAIDDIAMTSEARDVTELKFTTSSDGAATPTYKAQVKVGDTVTINDKVYEFTNGGRTNGADNIAVDLSGIDATQVHDVVQALADKVEESDSDILATVADEKDNGGNVSASSLKLTTKYKAGATVQYAAPKVETPRTSHSLDLQIGDDAELYNRMEVKINAVNSSELGLSGLDISSQNSARDAMAVIKDAINKVSDVRGTLGATQNRLDHTINNLSVMTENIQDAESTIRDTDVADEMMAYTKNNILIQSAQAMLAQANQVPQGVLQLLQ